MEQMRCTTAQKKQWSKCATQQHKKRSSSMPPPESASCVKQSKTSMSTWPMTQCCTKGQRHTLSAKKLMDTVNIEVCHVQNEDGGQQKDRRNSLLELFCAAKNELSLMISSSGVMATKINHRLQQIHVPLNLMQGCSLSWLHSWKHAEECFVKNAPFVKVPRNAHSSTVVQRRFAQLRINVKSRFAQRKTFVWNVHSWLQIDAVSSAATHGCSACRHAHNSLCGQIWHPSADSLQKLLSKDQLLQMAPCFTEPTLCPEIIHATVVRHFGRRKKRCFCLRQHDHF